VVPRGTGVVVQSRLSPIQLRVIDVLAGFEPRWTLTGGGALAGFHLGHRDTRDLDLFFHGRRTLDHVPTAADGTLRAAGLDVRVDQSFPGFARFIVSDGVESTKLDLVAEAVPSLIPPSELAPGVFVDDAQEILANKLGAILGRSELRDLLDVKALVEAGHDLDRAIHDAAQKDGGMSPPTLAWLLDQMPIERMARGHRLDPAPLTAFRDQLVKKLLS